MAQPKICDCRCHRIGGTYDGHCCEGQCFGCGRWFSAGLKEHQADCGAMLRRVPPEVMKQAMPVRGGS